MTKSPRSVCNQLFSLNQATTISFLSKYILSREKSSRLPFSRNSLRENTTNQWNGYRYIKLSITLEVYFIKLRKLSFQPSCISLTSTNNKILKLTSHLISLFLLFYNPPWTELEAHYNFITFSEFQKYNHIILLVFFLALAHKQATLKIADEVSRTSIATLIYNDRAGASQ